MKKARRLNSHVFSMLKARCPLEDKQACAIKQSGAPLHRIKFENTVSAFETLPQKGAYSFSVFYKINRKNLLTRLLQEQLKLAVDLDIFQR